MLGFAWMLERFCRERLGASAHDALAGEKALVLGSGGASQAVVDALAHTVGARPVVISRTGEETYATLVERHADAVLLVNATPVGMFPRCPASPLPEAGPRRARGAQGRARRGLQPGAHRALPRGGATRPGRASRASPCSSPGALRERALPGGARWTTRSPLEVEREPLLPDAQRRAHRHAGRPARRAAAARSAARSAGPSSTWTRSWPPSAAGARPRSSARTGEAAFRALETEGHRPLRRALGARHRLRRGRRHAPGELRPAAPERHDRPSRPPPLDQLGTEGRPVSPGARGRGARRRAHAPRYRAWADLVVACTGTPQGDAARIRELLGL